ncbi:MAG: type II toxin-antitoxin system Phd/YefM family antitoxin [Verrucomicrobia bacterium]|nr:type II toxin-antitoxin system Phd/YefM family antitoxin [Verrucomicrobiota bacterium]
MKTLSITEARAHLSAVLERAKKGEDIGIIAGNQVIQLKPVEVVAWEDSYLYQEYNVTPEEWERFRKRQARKLQSAQRAGALKFFSGDLEKDIVD